MSRKFGSLEPPSEQFSSLSVAGDNRGSEVIQFCPKKYGKEGVPVNLFVNFFKISLKKHGVPNFYHYNIEIIEEEEGSAPKAGGTSGGGGGGGGGGRKNRAAAAKKQAQVEAQAQQQPKKDSTPKSKKSPKRLHDEVFKQVFIKFKNVFDCTNLPVFDGEKNFYSTTSFRLPNNQWTGVVEVMDKEKLLKMRVNITIPEYSHGQNLSNLMQKTDKLMPLESQAMDIIMRNGPRLKKITLGSNFFLKSSDPNARNYQFDLGDQRFTDPIKYGQFGHYQAFRKCEDGLFYNVDRAMAIFTEGGKLTNFITQMKGDMRAVEEYVKSLKFTALHLPYKRTFVISGFSEKSCKETFFNEDRNGQKSKISVYDYFMREYPNFCQRFRLDPRQRCVQVGSRSNAKHFPIETVELEYDEIYRRKLDAKLQGLVTRKSSQQTPLDRFSGIANHIKTITSDNTMNNVNYLNMFGIESIQESATKIQGRILNAPRVEYGSEKFVDTKNSGQWDLRGMHFLEPGQIGSDWAVVNISKVFGRDNRTSIPDTKIDELIAKMISDGKSKGIKISHPKVVKYTYDYVGKNCLDRGLFSEMKGMRIVVMIIPDRTEIYNEIKAISELKYGIVTQCLNQSKNYWRNDMKTNQSCINGQLLTNFFLKINPKTQGENQTINKLERPDILRKKLMFIGLDVTHPSPTDNLSKSIAACVATNTSRFDKCYHRIVVQEKARKEVVNLKAIVKEMLERFASKNKGPPNVIIVYRDGIGEGDFEKVISIEMNSVMAAAQELGKTDIKITYIMVQKRHNTRFIPVNAKSQDKANRQNVAPGTVVDRQITHHKFFEFYLCSHVGMMGTSRPTKYVVLHDDNNLSADEIQKMTYYTCYLYPRCTKSSSIPPYVFYAHLMAKRARAYLAHLDESDGKSSVSSGGKLPVLSQAQINDFNQSISVQDNLNGFLFFI